MSGVDRVGRLVRKLLVGAAIPLGLVLGYLLGDLVAPTPIDVGGVIVQAFWIAVVTLLSTVLLTGGIALWALRGNARIVRVLALEGALALLASVLYLV